MLKIASIAVNENKKIQNGTVAFLKMNNSQNRTIICMITSILSQTASICT